jgi:O-antigen/teichoic acid export membrane protein
MLYKDPTGQITLALLLTGILLLFIVPLTPYIAIIQSRQRYYVAAIADVISKYIGLATIYLWFTSFAPTVDALIVILMVMLFLSRLALVPMAYKLVPGLRINPGLFDRKLFRQIALFGASTVLASICLALNSTGIRWLMSFLESISFVTHLAIMLMPGLILSYLIGAMVITIMPATSAYSAMDNQLMLQELMVRGMRYLCIFVLTVLLGFGLIIKPIFIFWLGPEYMLLIPYTLAILTGLAFMEITSVSHHMLKGLGQLKVVVYIYFTGFVLIPFPTILVAFQYSNDPYLSVSIGLILGNYVVGLLQTIVCAKFINVRLSTIMFKVFIHPLLIALIVAIFAYNIESHVDTENVVSQIVISTLAMILFLAGCYTIITSSKERLWIKNTLVMLKSIMLSFVRK